MRKKRYVQKLVVGMALGILVCGISSKQAAASMSAGTEVEAVNQTITDGGYSSNLVWMTKTKSGIKYKRLYVLESKKWLTDWIHC